MIQIRKNPNFPQWFQVISFGRLVDEFSSRANAVRVATQEAKAEKQKHIMCLGKTLDINS